ncbi:hypothetical protein F4782DRAFT_524454 [Xylaria castorea]|nr:hypothetical protein F4782DRAFT_524454 [Xylaria castorea]
MACGPLSSFILSSLLDMVTGGVKTTNRSSASLSYRLTGRLTVLLLRMFCLTRHVDRVRVKSLRCTREVDVNWIAH